MNLSELNDQQRAAVECLDSPLFIQAGAGTGKTHTLAQRLVYALSEDSGPKLDDVDELLTITFTDKAAGELLGRIRSTLRSEGLEEESLAIDSAWISTIHSMCKRVLSSFAFETGVDSAAVLLSEEQRTLFFGESFNRVLELHTDTSECDELIEDYGIEKVRTMVSHMASALTSTPGGRGSMEYGPSPLPTSEILRGFSEGIEAVLLGIEQLGSTERDKTGVQKAYGRINSALETMHTLFGSDMSVGVREAYLLLSEYDPSWGRNRGKAIDPLRGLEFDAAAQAFAQVMVAKQRADARFLMDIAQEVQTDYEAFKRREGVMDTDELLSGVYRLLVGNPTIAQHYRDQFGLVMVDEFQDTDRLQVGIIEQITGSEFKTLATVGDQQQSIYGFRGADVSVYKEQQKRMVDVHQGKDVTLSVNYRSHDQILRFVHDVFSQPEVFGDDLISLTAGRIEPEDRDEPEPPYLLSDQPRVRLLMAAGSTEQSSRGMPTSLLREQEGRMIAQEFAELRAQGKSAGDMVVLLNKMSNCQMYIDALRAQGFDCMVTGGSTFYKTDEVNVLIDYLNALVNPYDSRALTSTLISPLFALSDDALLQLASYTSAYEGLTNCREPSVMRAAQLLERALRRVDNLSAAEVIQGALADSGWDLDLLTRGAEGVAAYANITKFMDLAREYEQENGRSLVHVAQYFTRVIDYMEAGGNVKAKPGTLVAESFDVVRIMTTHSSKGLEFPIVAVAEYVDHKPEVKSDYITTEGDRTYVAIKPAPKSAAKNTYKDYFEDYINETGAHVENASSATSALEFFSYLQEKKTSAYLPEKQRLLYVACTRAREVLILALHDGKIASEPEQLPENRRFQLFGDIEHGVFRTTGFPHANMPFTFGNGVRGSYRFGPVNLDDAVRGEGASDGGGGGKSAADYGVEQAETENSDDYHSSIVDFSTVQALRPRLHTGAGEYLSAERVRTPLTQSYSSLSKQGVGTGAVKAFATIEIAEVTEAAGIAEVTETAGTAVATEAAGAAAAASDAKVHLSLARPSVNKAMDFGSAFHLVAQWLIETELLFSAAESAHQTISDIQGNGACLQGNGIGLQPLDGILGKRISLASRQYALDGDDGKRLKAALYRWIVSARATELCSFQTVYTEYPFLVDVNGGIPLEGLIDVLCIDKTRRQALIIDYKTGTSAAGERAELEERYRFQAICYAYAVFAGFTGEEIEQVELAFVRPEVESAAGLEEVCYEFERARDFDRLAGHVVV